MGSRGQTNKVPLILRREKKKKKLKFKERIKHLARNSYDLLCIFWDTVVWWFHVRMAPSRCC